MKSETLSALSPLRLRIGFLCIFLWWAPFWALAPYFAKLTGINTSAITIFIMAVQTAFGLAGLIIVGKQTSKIFKKSSFKESIKMIIYVLLHGKLKDSYN